MRRFLLYIFLLGVAFPASHTLGQANSTEFGMLLLESFKENDFEKLKSLTATEKELVQKATLAFPSLTEEQTRALEEKLSSDYADHLTSLQRRFEQIQSDATANELDLSQAKLIEVVTSEKEKKLKETSTKGGSVSLIDLTIRFSVGNKKYDLISKGNFDLQGIIKMGGKPDVNFGNK